MRLRQLQLQRYGHFVDASLEFSGEGLQVVHGHNEAGKSTLLQFVREVLFGFRVQNPYAFAGERLEGAAALHLSNGDSATLQRRKGKIDTLTLTRNGEPESLTESQLQMMLGGATGTLFESVFAFGLAELARGEESLKVESVQHALHGSGLSGLANPQKILDQLIKDSETIYKERGSKQEVPAICAEIKSLTSQLKEKITRTETYLQRKRDHDAAKSEAEQLAEQLGKLRQDFARVKKLVTAYPLWRELTQLQDRRQALGPTSALGATSRSQFEKLLDDEKRLTRESTKLDREMQAAEGDLQKNPAQTEWLELRSQIEQARELIVSAQEARRDLPLLEAQLKADQDQVQLGIQDVIGSWSVRELEAFRCDAGQRARCEELADARRELDNERIRLEERAASLAQEQVANQADLNTLGDLTDITGLQALLNQYADQVAREAELARLTKESGKQQRTVTAQLRKLSPPLATSVDIHSLPIPPDEQIQLFATRFAEVHRRILAAEQSRAESQNRLDQLERDLRSARGSIADIPTAEGLKGTRTHRDAGWKLIEQRLNDAKPAKDEKAWLSNTEESLTAAFEQAVRTSDQYADKMFDNASLVHQQEQVDAGRREVATKQDDLKTQQQASDELTQQWNALWHGCGFEPFDPDTMLAWRDHYDRWLELTSLQADLQDDINQTQRQIDDFNARVAAALPHFAGRADERIAAAQLTVSRHQQQVQDQKTYQRQATKLQKTAEQLAEDCRLFVKRHQEFAEQWQVWLSALRFPTDWQPELALTVVNRLQNLRDKLQQIPALEGRLQAMSRRLDEFDPFVAKLCDQVAPDWKAQPTEVAARHLADRLQSAIDTDTRRTALTRELSKHRTKLDEIKEQQQSLRSEHQRLLDLATTTTDDAFFHEADRADSSREIESQISAKQKELKLLREFDEESAFFGELQQVDFAALDASRQSLEQQIQHLEDEERRANERKGATGKELEQLDGSAAAADIQSAINQRRAALANAIDRYVPLLFARQMLQKTLEKFEKESQPEMLNDVSKLFRDMTGGRYQRVERPRDASRPLIVYRGDQAEVLEPQELSTGTREQLYLAIRLAYVLHYCTKAEPLPIVLDDVFANFDPGRTRKTLEALGHITDRVQVLLFTCHPHVVGLAQEVFPDLRPVAVPAAGVRI